MTCATFVKEITYDRETRDYAMYLDGNPCGFARTYHEAEVTLDQLVWELLNSGITHTATELDSGIPDEDDPPLPNEIPGTNPPFADVCPSCGDQRVWGGPGLCATCQEDQPVFAQHTADAPSPGRAIGRMWHKQPRDFIAVLSQLDSDAWLTLAEAYAAWRDSYLTTSDVLNLWANAVEGTTVVPANGRPY
jgi:hypothetical protein